MAIKFFNIRSRETRVAESEPQIAAMYNSSDNSPNAQQGQDFGWRLAPEVVVQLRRIKSDPRKMMDIATIYGRMPGELNDSDVLQYISDQTSIEQAPVATEEDYSDEYADEIRRLQQQFNGEDKPAKSDGKQDNPQAISLDDMSIDELEAELAARKKLANDIAKANETTTTTTTDKPKRNQSASNS